MSQEENTSGIPTRAIHESYLDMQRALQQYRQAKDRADSVQVGNAHGSLQETVLTFYEMLRPHIRSNHGVNDWWDGTLPSYPQDGSMPDPDDGKAILDIQRRTENLIANNVDLQSCENYKDYHETLDVADDIRITGIMTNQTQNNDTVVVIAYQAYQMGLRHLDSWETTYKTTQQTLGGFMGSKTKQKQERQRVAISKLKRAARELADVAEQLGALSEFDASLDRTEITDQQMEELEAWRQQQLQ